MRKTMIIAAAVFAMPMAAFAQAGVTQSRDGLSTATQGKGDTNNSSPAGSVNAATGPQSQPAYPSGSSTPNPGAAFVQTMPKPETGALQHPPGVLTTQTVTGAGTTAQPQSPGVGQAAAPPK